MQFKTRRPELKQEDAIDLTKMDWKNLNKQKAVFLMKSEGGTVLHINLFRYFRYFLISTETDPSGL